MTVSCSMCSLHTLSLGLEGVWSQDGGCGYCGNWKFLLSAAMDIRLADACMRGNSDSSWLLT